MTQPTHITQVGTVIISVRDQDRALEFYTDRLGFEKRLDAPFGPGGRWIEVAPAGAVTTIALTPATDGAHTSSDVSLDTHDAEADHAALRSEGVDVDQAVMRMGDGVPLMFAFRDPDGNRFRVVERP